MARELSENNRARSDGEESPGGLSMQSSSNYLAPSEPPGSEVSALEMSQDEDYHSCDADAGLEVEEEVEASEELVADEDRALISEMPEGTQDEDISRWKPGSNCGSFLDKFNPVTPQSLVLLGNVYTNLAKVPVNLLKKVADYLPRREKFMRCSWLVVVVAEIFAVSYASVKTWIQDLKQQQWVPRKRQSVAEFKKQNAKESEISLAQDVVEKLNPRDSNEQIMKNLVSRALFLCCEGQSSLAYERDISNLLSMVGREQLGDQHHSRKFFYSGSVYGSACVGEAGGFTHQFTYSWFGHCFGFWAGHGPCVIGFRCPGPARNCFGHLFVFDRVPWEDVHIFPLRAHPAIGGAHGGFPARTFLGSSGTAPLWFQQLFFETAFGCGKWRWQPRQGR